MKNSHLPLIQALKNRMKPKEMIGPEDMPRTFELKHTDIPGLVGRKVGEGISVNLAGRIHSQHADGHTVMHVSSVKPDSAEMDGKENPDQKNGPKEIRVRTQESNVP